MLDASRPPKKTWQKIHQPENKRLEKWGPYKWPYEWLKWSYNSYKWSYGPLLITWYGSTFAKIAALYMCLLFPTFEFFQLLTVFFGGRPVKFVWAPVVVSPSNCCGWNNASKFQNELSTHLSAMSDFSASDFWFEKNKLLQRFGT